MAQTQMGVRDYDPTIGRFTQVDPDPGSPAVPITQNPYIYAADNPVNMVDLDGHSAAALAAPVGIALGISCGPVCWAVMGAGTGLGLGIMYAKKSKKSGKEAGTDIPSWAKGKKPKQSESGKDFGKRVLEEKYGQGNYPTGPGSEYSKLKKWADRNK